MYQNIVLHIPHDSTFIPESLGDRSLPAYRTLLEGSYYLVDYYTLPLFGAGGNPQIHAIVAPFNRVLVDMERMPDDPLEGKGFGIMSKWALDWLGMDYRTRALMDYAAYHDRAVRMLEALEMPLVIDCHSFSAHPTPLCAVPPDIDICIGWNNDWSKPDDDTLCFVKEFFDNHGYIVKDNDPFSNSKTFSDKAGYHSLMIEVNKRCYMNEESLERTEGFDRLHNILNELYLDLLNKK